MRNDKRSTNKSVTKEATQMLFLRPNGVWWWDERKSRAQRGLRFRCDAVLAFRISARTHCFGFRAMTASLPFGRVTHPETNDA